MGLLSTRYKFNGVISTDKTIMQNLEIMCSAAGTWLTFDIHAGKWSFVINKPESSIASFDDSNIIGSISISVTGLTELYNSVKVEFPHIDLNDQKDFIRDEIPTVDRNPNEPNNELGIQYDIINDPVQAEMLGLIELKQSRVDKVIQFTTDFSHMGLKAGDVIDITSDVYSFSEKKFRIVTISENDGQDGSINLIITGLEYDENVYSTDDLIRYSRTTSNGIATIGGIGIPGTPTVNKFEKNSRPRLLIETTTPTGIVEAMECWMTPSTTTNWTLAGTVTAPTGTTYDFGTQVDFDIDYINGGDYYIKTRGINATTTGPFSEESGLINYVPAQTTDAIGPDTAIQDDNGDNLLGLLGANALLALLGNLFNNDASGGSIYDQLLNLINSETGLDLFGGTQSMGVTKIISSNQVNAIIVPGDSSWHYTIINSGTIPNTGNYSLNYNINWGGSGYPGQAGVLKTSKIVVYINSIPIDIGQWGNTGDEHVQLYEDHNITGLFSANAGDDISYAVGLRTDWPIAPSSGSAAAWVIATLTLIP